MIIFEESLKKTLIEFGNGDVSIFYGLSEDNSVGFIYLLDSLGTYPIGTTLPSHDFGISCENMAEKSNIIIRFNNKRSLRVLIDMLMDLYSDMDNKFASNSHSIVGEE